MAKKKSISKPLPHKIRFDQGRHPRAALGFVLLATEPTIEHDMFQLAPPGVDVHFTRARMPNEITVENLAAVEAELAGAAALLQPDGDLDVICYACTSGSVVIGEERVMAQLSRGAPNAAATTLITGVIRALRALHVRRIVVATPYIDEINELEKRYLHDRGFEVLNMEGMTLINCTDMHRVAPDFIKEYAQSMDCADDEAIFESGGALRTIEKNNNIEQSASKQVVASNKVML